MNALYESGANPRRLSPDRLLLDSPFFERFSREIGFGGFEQHAMEPVGSGLVDIV